MWFTIGLIVGGIIVGLLALGVLYFGMMYAIARGLNL